MLLNRRAEESIFASGPLCCSLVLVILGSSGSLVLVILGSSGIMFFFRIIIFFVGFLWGGEYRGYKYPTLMVASGVDESAINLTPVPSDLGLFSDFTFFEIVLRLFRFEDQSLGNAYLEANHPVFYVSASTKLAHEPIPTRGYKPREDSKNVNEKRGGLEADFGKFGETIVAGAGETFRRDFSSVKPIQFNPLYIIGTECLRNGSKACLGDCPDAAYFGPNIFAGNDTVRTFQMLSDDEVDIVTLVNHKKQKTGVYNSIAVMSSPSSTLSQIAMDIRASDLGLTSFDFGDLHSDFIAHAFTRNSKICERLLSVSADAPIGCSVIEDSVIKRPNFFTYCERVYLNPTTGTGPDWKMLVTANLYRLKINLGEPALLLPPSRSNDKIVTRNYGALKNIEPVTFKVFDGNEPFRFLHIIKTGGEALEGYVRQQTSPKISFDTCRRAAFEPSVGVEGMCQYGGAFVSTMLCGLNCECCAADIKAEGGFHGTLLRSPRAHVLSQFSHCHIAHHGTWKRALMDIPLYFAELILRGTEAACDDSCDGGNADWLQSLEQKLIAVEREHGNDETHENSVKVISVANTLSHALTCTKSRGSLGHHFRVLDGTDSLKPNLEDALRSMREMEWIGVTDLFEPSICLLHYTANGTLPLNCGCDWKDRNILANTLGHWVETRSTKRSPSMLSQAGLQRLDKQTEVDAVIFAEGLKLILGRLKYVEEQTGVALLRCIDWDDLILNTSYIKGLWDDLLEKGEIEVEKK